MIEAMEVGYVVSKERVDDRVSGLWNSILYGDEAEQKRAWGVLREYGIIGLPTTLDEVIKKDSAPTKATESRKNESHLDLTWEELESQVAEMKKKLDLYGWQIETVKNYVKGKKWYPDRIAILAMLGEDIEPESECEYENS